MQAARRSTQRRLTDSARLRPSPSAAPAHPAASAAPAEALRVCYPVSGQPRAGGGPLRNSGRALPGPPGRVVCQLCVSAADQPTWGLRAPGPPRAATSARFSFRNLLARPNCFSLLKREVWARVNTFPTVLIARIKGSQPSTRR